MSEFDSHRLAAIIVCTFVVFYLAVLAVEWFLSRRKK